LVGRLQRVKINDRFSGYRRVKSGVPQGSVLGPILFTAFVNDIFAVVESCSVHAYADDIQIYLSRRVGLIEDLAARVNEDLCKINNWAARNCLSLNPAKSCVLPIAKTPVDTGTIPQIFVGDTPLPFVNKTVNLGFVINSTLTCSDHINTVVSKIYYVLRNLRRTANCTPLKTKLHLVKQLIMPIISYAETVYPCLDSASMHKLQVAFNYATRYVYCLRRREGVSEWSREILGCTVEEYLKIRSCLFLFKLINTQNPPYLYEKLRLSQSNRCVTFILPSFQYASSRRLFFISAVRLWNSLPMAIKRTSEGSKFKSLVVNHFSS